MQYTDKDINDYNHITICKLVCVAHIKILNLKFILNLYNIPILNTMLKDFTLPHTPYICVSLHINHIDNGLLGKRL